MLLGKPTSTSIWLKAFSPVTGCVSAPDIQWVTTLLSFKTSHIVLQGTQQLKIMCLAKAQIFQTQSQMSQIQTGNHAVIRLLLYPSDCSHPYVSESTVRHVRAMASHHLPRVCNKCLWSGLYEPTQQLSFLITEKLMTLLHLQHSAQSVFLILKQTDPSQSQQVNHVSVHFLSS